MHVALTSTLRLPHARTPPENSWLNNVGLLLAVLIGKDGKEVVQVSMVTQVVST